MKNGQGRRPALDRIVEINKLSLAGDDLFIRLANKIRIGLRDISEKGVTPWDNFRGYRFIDESFKGYRVKFDLVKKLIHNKPLFEFRINQKRYPDDLVESSYAFRMIFFMHVHDRTKFMICTDAMIKRSRSSAVFNKMIKNSLLSYERFLSNPKYFIKEE